MREASRRQDREIGAVRRLDIEGEETFRRERASRVLDELGEIAEIDEGIGSENEVDLLMLALEEGYELGELEAIIELPRRRFLEHARGNVDADQLGSQPAQERRPETGAAAEIEHPAESPSRRLQKRAQLLGHMVVEDLRERLIETVGEAVEIGN